MAPSVEQLTAATSPGNETLLDEQWHELAEGAWRRTSLWRDDTTGERFRTVEVFAEDGDGFRRKGQSLAGADYFLVSRSSETAAWRETVASAAASGWTICPERFEGYVATAFRSELGSADLDTLDALLAGLRALLPPEYVADWPRFYFPAATPSDSLYPQQWAHAQMNSPAAWARTVGSEEVVVAVIDTGIATTHPDLAPNLWQNPAPGQPGNPTGFVNDLHGWNFFANSNNVSDTNGHGTAVAGILGAAGNNGIGIAGTAWDVRLMTLKVGENSYPEAAVIDAIDYAIRQRLEFGVNVVAINGSFAGNFPGVAADEETPLFLAVRRARDAGILCVFAAGNAGLNNDALVGGQPNHTFPSDFALDHILSVANSTQGEVLAGNSNYGPISVDLAAPGTDILTTLPGGLYQTRSGTSFAAPHVSGAAALAASLNPHLDVFALRRILLDGNTPVPGFADTLASGTRLATGSALDEAARWPLIASAPGWDDMPFINTADPAPLAASITSEDAAINDVVFFLNDEPITASLDAPFWSASWQPPSTGSHHWTISATAAGNRSVANVPLPLEALAPYPFWLSEAFGPDYATAAAAFAAQHPDGPSLPERFVFGLGTAPTPLAPPPSHGVPSGTLVTAFNAETATLDLRFWQSQTALPVAPHVLRSTTLASDSWETALPLTDEIEATDSETGRILRRLTLPASAPAAFYRLSFDLN